MILTIIVIGLTTIATLGTLGLAAVWLLQHLERTKPIQPVPGEALESRLAALEIKVDALPSLWEHERQIAERAADSARKARASAEKKLRELEELDDADEEFPGGDGEGGAAQGVLPLRGNLGVPPAPSRADRIAAVAHLLR